MSSNQSSVTHWLPWPGCKALTEAGPRGQMSEHLNHLQHRQQESSPPAHPSCCPQVPFVLFQCLAGFISGTWAAEMTGRELRAQGDQAGSGEPRRMRQGMERLGALAGVKSRCLLRNSSCRSLGMVLSAAGDVPAFVSSVRCPQQR